MTVSCPVIDQNGASRQCSTNWPLHFKCSGDYMAIWGEDPFMKDGWNARPIYLLVFSINVITFLDIHSNYPRIWVLVYLLCASKAKRLKGGFHTQKTPLGLPLTPNF